MAVSSGAVEVVQSWAEISSQEQIKEAIDIRAPSGTSLCLAASLPKSLQKGTILSGLHYKNSSDFLPYSFVLRGKSSGESPLILRDRLYS